MGACSRCFFFHVAGDKAFMDRLTSSALLLSAPHGQPTIYVGAGTGVSSHFKGHSSAGCVPFEPVLWGKVSRLHADRVDRQDTEAGLLAPVPQGPLPSAVSEKRTSPLRKRWISSWQRFRTSCRSRQCLSAPRQREGVLLYSTRTFWSSKNTGGFRPILDRHRLNRCIACKTFF